MMNKCTTKIVAILTVIFGLLIITSCEYKGDYYYEIENESSYNFDLYFKVGNYLDSVKSINHNSKETFYMHDDFNGMRDLEDRFLARSGIDTIYFVIYPDSLEISKNPMLRENWEYTTKPIKKDKPGRGGDNIYTMTIEEGDIN